MDFEKLVQPISDYLTFSIGFWLGEPEIFANFLSNSSISPKALLFSIVGTTIYLIFRYAKFGIVPVDPDSEAQTGPSIDTNSLLLFIMLGLYTPILIEFSFWTLSTRATLSIGSAYDSFNASFLSAALLLPFSGLAGRVSLITSELKKVGGKVAKLSMLLNIAIAISTIFVSLACFKPVLALHQVSAAEIAGPIFVMILTSLFLFIVLAFFLYHWNKFIILRDKLSKAKK